MPQYLHRPSQILVFESDEFAVILVFVFLAFVLGGIFWLLVFLAPFAYIRLKQRYGRGFLYALIYAMGINILKGIPSFFEDEFNQ